MRRMFAVIAVLVVTFVMGGAAAYAQVAKMNIGLPFVVNGKDMPAGSYTIRVTSARAVSLKGEGDAVLVLTAVTRLGRRDKNPDPELVFDKVDGKMLLSEIWLPRRDGYLVLGTTEEHEHAVLGGSILTK